MKQQCSVFHKGYFPDSLDQIPELSISLFRKPAQDSLELWSRKGCSAFTV
jgi:hypothetical protein